MSKLDELLKEYCPDGVEYRRLSNVACLISGMKGVSNKWAESGNCQFIDYLNAYNHLKIDISYRPYATVSKLDNQNTLKQYDILLTSASETQDECAISSVIEDEIPDNVLLDDHLFCVRLNDPKQLNAVFLNYYFRSSEFKAKIIRAVRGVTRYYVSVKDFMKLDIPVPPLPVQEEIVRILDSFTELTTKLTTELTAELAERKKQYEYYRNKLLTFSKGQVQYKKLGDIFSFRNGLSKGKDFFGSGVPFIRYTDVYNNRFLHADNIEQYVECTPEEIEKLRVSRGDVFFTRTSETAEDVGWSSVMLDDIENCVFNGFTIKASPITDDLLPEYCAYCFSTDDFRKYVTTHCAFTTRASLTGSTIAEYKIAIPSHDVQRKIAYTLDNFEKICSDLNIGLPAEIEARQKQYEYYRDSLLTFAETGDIIAQTDRQTDRQNIIRLVQYVFGYAPVRLDDIATIARGGSLQKKDLVGNGHQCIHYGQLYTHFGVHTDRCISCVPDDVYAKSKKAVPGDIIMAVTSENVEDVCSCTAWLGSEPIAVSGHTAIIHHDQDARYLSYYFHSADFFRQKKKLAHGTKVIEVTPSALGDIVIPLPSAEKQRRVADMLDRFDALCSDISERIPAEIEARRKQYEYYRNRLLSFEKAKNND